MKTARFSLNGVTKSIKASRRLAAFLLLPLVWSVASLAQRPTPKTTVTEKSLLKYMTALASDEMRGRGSATPDELRAAEYIAAQL